MKRFAALCGFSFLAFASVVVLASAQEHTKDSLDVIKKRLQEKKAVLLDVREQKEWDAGHLKDAKLLPLSTVKGNAPGMTDGLAKDQIIYLHCAAGVRCVTAAEILQKLGYDARPIKEGYNDLVKSGFPKAEK